MRPTLLLDVDGPLANFTRSYLDAFEDVTGRAITVEQVDRFAINECPFFSDAATDMAIPVAKLREMVESYVSLSGFCKDIPVQHGAPSAVARLSEVADVYALTSPWHSSRTWAYERTAWLWENFQIPAKRVVLTASKYLMRGDVLLDDRASHVEEWGKAWPDGDAVLFDMHHNKTEGEGLRRGGWADVIEAVERRSTKAA